MKKWFKRLTGSRLGGVDKVRTDSFPVHKNECSNSAKSKKIEEGAKDFAVRFESVMRDLAKG